MQSSHDELTSVTTPNFSSLEHRTGKVLVIGSEHRMMLPIIRSLGRKDLQVHVAWCPPGNITLRSRYIHKTHPIPAFADGDDAWLLALQKLLKSQTFDLVIPATEEAVFPMHQTREVWEKYPSVWLLNDKAFKFAFNKVKIYDLATSL
ncbi:MAG: hypothetical protein GY702_23030, partial [Desulfobulbaceae bacterium]|nr:hypothetical protein [Desulfobulbaceae bacterium]